MPGRQIEISTDVKKLTVTRHKWFIVRWVPGLLTAGCLLSVSVLAAPPGGVEEERAVSAAAQANDASATADSQAADEFDALPMNMNNPGSIVDRLEEDAEPKEYLFQFPGVSRGLKPWYDFKDKLDEKHGFKFGISYTAY